MVPSPRVATYDLSPAMSADQLTASCIEAIESGVYSLIVINYANPDMVGHTGVFDAIVKAVEVTDDCLREVVEAGRANGYQFIVIADHGNADFARHPDGSPHTAHTTNPVPVVVLSERVDSIQDGILADVAPTVLKLMGILQPPEMTGTALH